jgi:hypothetical protein
VVLKFWIERHRTDWNDEKLHSQLLGFMAGTPEEYVVPSRQINVFASALMILAWTGPNSC